MNAVLRLVTDVPCPECGLPVEADADVGMTMEHLVGRISAGIGVKIAPSLRIVAVRCVRCGEGDLP